jgi:hypothetical protein
MSQQRRQRRKGGSPLPPAINLDESFEAFQRILTQNFFIDPQIMEPTINNQQLETSRKRKASEVEQTPQNHRKKRFKKEQED